MSALLLGFAGLILACTVAALVLALRGPTDADRMMAVQALGTGGIAALLLLGMATGAAGTIDVALALALLAAFASVVFVITSGRPKPP